MSQGPLIASISAYGGVKIIDNADFNNTLMTTRGGWKSSLNITAATAIKASAGRIAKIIIVAQGTSGSFTFNDVTTTGGAAASNQILTFAFNAYAVGTVLDVDWPCLSGITLSAVPAGSPIIVVSYT